MDTLTLDRKFMDLSSEVFSALSIFQSIKAQLSDVLFDRLAKKSQELYKLTNRLIKDFDNSEAVKELPHIEDLYKMRPLVQMLCNFDFRANNDKEAAILYKHEDTIIVYKRTIALVADLIESLIQWFEDGQRHNVSYYIELIADYRNARRENIEINQDFEFIDLVEWE